MRQKKYTLTYFNLFVTHVYVHMGRGENKIPTCAKGDRATWANTHKSNGHMNALNILHVTVLNIDQRDSKDLASHTRQEEIGYHICYS